MSEFDFGFDAGFDSPLWASGVVNLITRGYLASSGQIDLYSFGVIHVSG